jgi:cytochrome c oxidase subunit 1
LPRIRSERPAFDLHHPELAGHDTPTADKGVLDQLLGEPEMAARGHGTNPPTKRGNDIGNQGVQE